MCIYLYTCIYIYIYMRGKACLRGKACRKCTSCSLSVLFSRRRLFPRASFVSETPVCQKCTSKGIGRQGNGVEAWELLTGRACALSSYALTCAAPSCLDGLRIWS